MIKKTLSSTSLTAALGLFLTTFLALQIATRDAFRINDEAVNLTMAKNMTIDDHYIIKPTYEPINNNSIKKTYSFSNVLMPPFYPFLIYKTSDILKIDIFKAANILQAVLVAIFFFVLFSNNKKDYILALSLLAFSPKVLNLMTNLEHEGILCAFGFLSIYFSKKDGYLNIILSGLCLGIGFLSKTWLVGPFVLGVAVNMINGLCKNKINPQKFLTLFFLVSTSFLFISCLHLVFIYFKDPQNLNLWVEQVYLGVLKSGANSKISSSKVQGWGTQWWYYFGVFARENFLLSSTLFFSITNKDGFFRLFNFKNISYFIVFASFLILSLVKIKEPAYILPSLLAVIFLIDFDRLKLNKKTYYKLLLISIYVALVNLPLFSKYVHESIEFINFGLLFLIFICIKTPQKRIQQLTLVTILSASFHSYVTINHNQKFTELKEISDLINKTETDLKNNQICAGNYGMISYFTGKKVIKLDWFRRFTDYVSSNAKYIILEKTYKFNKNSEAYRVLEEKYYSLKKYKHHTLYKRSF